MEADGATIVQGNTDVAVADFDYSAAFPWFTDGVPDAFRAAAEWAHDALGDERLGWLRRLPVGAPPACSTTRWSSPATRRPARRPQGFDAQLDPSVVLERISRTDARVICCGHTHLPEVRDLGWKLIVNDGSRGLRLRRRPDRVVGARRDRRRRGHGRDPRGPSSTRWPSSNAISARGLPGDVYRAATVRTGKLVR